MHIVKAKIDGEGIGPENPPVYSVKRAGAAPGKRRFI
jgi:hypothetical protein